MLNRCNFHILDHRITVDAGEVICFILQRNHYHEVLLLMKMINLLLIIGFLYLMISSILRYKY